MARSAPLSRRDWFKLASAGALGGCMSGWMQALAADAAKDPKRKRSCILLWMNGGPSQTDTFDMKPDHENGGEFKEIETSAPGLTICEHLPKVAKFGDKMAVIRSMSTKEGDHGRATHLMRNGYLPQGAIQYPTLGSLIAKELGAEDAPLPEFVSIAPYRAFSPAAFSSGFLGPRYAPLIIGDPLGAGFFGQPQNGDNYDKLLKVEDIERPDAVAKDHFDARIDLLEGLDKDFTAGHPDLTARSHQNAYKRAVRLMRSSAGKAFSLEEEKDSVRDAYGRNLFGQGCLLARRLVERGVPFVEVTHGGANGIGWDTHGDNFNQVKTLCGTLDPAWAALMGDLKDRGLLDDVLIVWMGEFGRTPKMEGNGRNHYPNAWSTVLAGGGIKGGQAVGKTSKDGATVEERPVSAPDFLATVCGALGVDAMKQNLSNVGRPIRIVEKTAEPIKEIIAS
jgi:hypothetical protein